MMKMLRTFMIVMVLCISTQVFAYPGKIIHEIQSPYSRPTGLTFDGKNLWVADYKADKLICINPKSGDTIREIPSPGFWPMGLAWDGTHLWNVDIKQGKIFKIDPSDGTILKVIGAPSGSSEGLTWDGETLWVTDSGSREFMKIDLQDGTPVQTFSAPARSINGLTFDGTYFWCSDRIMDEIYMIDPKNGEVIIIADSPAPYPRGITWDGNYLWNVDYQTDKIYQIIRKDDDLYKLEDKRKATITFTHQAYVYGDGKCHNLDVYIAIPKNLPQQNILSTSFTPNNYDTVIDRWDQSFAHYQHQDVRAEATLQAVMTVQAEISDINYFIYPDQCGTISDIPADVRETYTANGSKYLIDDPYIQKLAKDIVGDEKNTYWAARKIFDHVRKTLEYKLEGGWNAAPVVLKRGTGSCSEYTFCFIALCRAAGLPARYVGSIVVRGDDASLDQVFHRWPEVYLPSYGWIPIDPQGGDDELSRNRAMNIGHLSNRFLITTQGGGDSKYMGWYYNSDETYKIDPKVQIDVEAYGEWDPMEAK